MFNKSPLHIAMLVVLFSMATNVYSASCDFLPPAIQPDWTFESAAIEGYYVGVGVSEADDLGADEQIERARLSALNDLSSNIEVRVKSTLSAGIQEEKLGDSTVTKKDFRQLTEAITSNVVKEVEVDSTWLDRKQCIVWMRVKVKRKIIDDAQAREFMIALIEQLDAHFEHANNREATIDEREMALKRAYVLLDEIDFSKTRGKKSKKYYQRLLDSLAVRVSKFVGQKEEAKVLRRDAENLLLKANSSTDADNRKELRVEAIGKLKNVIAINPIGENKRGTEGESAAFKIAEIEKSRNNACEAQLQYEIVRDRSKSKEWVAKASQMMETVKCNRKNKKTRSWRKEFDGVRTSFICAYDLKGDVDEWDKPCENVASFVQSKGALSGVDTGMASSDIVKLAYQLDKNSAAAKKLKDKGRVVLFVAKGKIKNRSNPKNPMGEDHQFTGKVYSYLLDNGKLEFRDKYTGTGGWNPVSEEMAMEVLGLNVAKRWKSKYLKHIQK